jgi:hypothetical protein
LSPKKFAFLIEFEVDVFDGFSLGMQSAPRAKKRQRIASIWLKNPGRLSFLSRLSNLDPPENLMRL